MPNYRYRALTQNGEIVHGTLSAPTALQVLADSMAKYTPEHTAELTDLTAEQVSTFAALFANNHPVGIRAGFGLSHWYHGDLHMQALLTLQAITGNIGVHGGGVTTVRLWREGHQLAVAIDDAGPGVSAQDRERVFERFSRAAASGRREEFGGTGLGLALVKEHVRAHDGTVSVAASPSGGARFVVRLPVASLDSGTEIAQMTGSSA